MKIPTWLEGMPYEVTGAVGEVFGDVHDTTPAGPMQPGPCGLAAGLKRPAGSSCRTYAPVATEDDVSPSAQATALTVVPVLTTAGALKGEGEASPAAAQVVCVVPQAGVLPLVVVHSHSGIGVPGFVSVNAKVGGRAS